MGITGEEKEKGKGMFKAIIAENYQTAVREIHIQILEAPKTPKRLNPKRDTL